MSDVGRPCFDADCFDKKGITTFGCIFFLGWPVMWILLYGYVIFPHHIATEKNHFIFCHSNNTVTQPETCEQTEIREQYCEQHYYNELPCCYYNEQTETYETTNIECERSVFFLWLCGFLAGIASAFFSYVLLTIIGAHPYAYIVRERIVAFLDDDDPPPTYTVTGAGRSEVNGTYVRNGTYNDRPRWENDNDVWLVSYPLGGGDYWYFAHKANIHADVDDYYRVRSESKLPPSDGWSLARDGIEPAPDIVANV